MRDHTKLRAFQLADELAVLVYRVTASFPREELYGLNQVNRLKVEGCQGLSFVGLQSKNLVNQLRLAKRLGYFSDQGSSIIEPKIVEAEKVLNGLI